MMFNAKDLQEMSNAVRANALYAISSAMSGHVGIVLGAADIVTLLYANVLRPGVDKFVLSAGHGSALLYAALSLSGHNINDLETFRQVGGLPGHPEFGIHGVCATTGPLGQGIGNAVGLALAAKIKKTPGRVYCLCSDGDLMEGVAQESIAFAGRNKLNNLVLLWDDNGISIDGVAQTDMDIPARMAAAGWRVLTANGNDFDELMAAVAMSGRTRGAPVFIQCKTKIGLASSLVGTPAAHGLSLGIEELKSLMRHFYSPSGNAHWARVAAENGARHDCSSPAWPTINFTDVKMPAVPTEISTRELSGMYLDQMLAAGINLIGGSADLGHSTNAKVSKSVDITPPEFNGNYINYGVREHAMGAIMNGLAADGVRAYGSTFLVFSDYMRPAIRIAALSGLPNIYVFTHDSVAVGEDGPTHQPIEQLPSLRMMPNLNVLRPCNAQEVAWAWRAAIDDTMRPSAIILSRQKVHQYPTPNDADLARGAYVIWPAKTRTPRITIIATGAEVALAISVAQKIGKSVAVVSMPCVSRFRMQEEKYKNQILRGRIVAIEAAAISPWFEFADIVFGVDRFGASGPGAEVYSRMGFDADVIARQIRKILK